MDEIAKKENAKRVQRAWVVANLDKMAIISRRCYDKKKEDPEYRKLLVQRTTAYRQRVKEAKLLEALTSNVVDKIVEPKIKPEPKKNGRPRKYP